MSDEVRRAADGRDEFPKPVQADLMKRVAAHCSRCHAPTSGPRSDPNGSISVGVAAHIAAAAKNGPRYDPAMTAEQRRSGDNAIWLCHNCSRIVDADEQRYTPEVLRDMKRSAEEWAQAELGRAQVQDLTGLLDEKSRAVRDVLARGMKCYDTMTILRYADSAKYDELGMPASLEREVDGFRAAIIPLEALVTEPTATTLVAFRKAIEATLTYAIARPVHDKPHTETRTEVTRRVWEQLDRSLGVVIKTLREECEPADRRAARERETQCLEALQVDGQELVSGLGGLAHVLITAGPPPLYNARTRLEQMNRRVADMLGHLQTLAKIRGGAATLELRRALEQLELHTLPAVREKIEQHQGGPGLFDPSWRMVFRPEESHLTVAAQAIRAHVDLL